MHYPGLVSLAIGLSYLTPSVLSVALPVSSSSLEARADEEHGVLPFPFKDDGADLDSLVSVFSKLESLPDTDDADALEAWLRDHKSELVPRAAAPVDAALVERQTAIQIAQCVFEIGKAIAENLFPLSKLRRLRELVRFLGGARAVAKMLLKAKTLKQLIIIGGPQLQELAYILLGLSDIAQACFTIF